MALLKCRPLYKLDVIHSLGQSSIQSTFYFSSKHEIKLFLRNYLGSVFQCILSKQYINYENNNLTTDYETITTELDNIKYVYYRLQIGTSQNSFESFIFHSLNEVKKFLSKYQTRLTLDLKYYVEEYTRYFDKDDRYKINQATRTLTDI